MFSPETRCCSCLFVARCETSTVMCLCSLVKLITYVLLAVETCYIL
uniref:Uncharacterized protein n=1 Tax=Triticum urartu TaxID=4572 RepID=A0A8R7QPK5_TRIUA